MRFLRHALFALAASTASVGANTLHQYKQRSQLDVCANVNGNVVIQPLNIIFTSLHQCICVSGIPNLLKTNIILQAAVAAFGEATVTASVNALITSSADHKQCNYPQHCTPQCGSNPCGFQCKDGYTPYPASNPTDCVCAAPYTVCNGVCGNFPSCSSQYPKAKRDASWRDTTCPHGWSACGVWGGSKLDYECVDSTRDLWSCGGCGIPLLPTDPIGVDCTAIPGVHDVSCLDSRCLVQRCKDGFRVSPDKTTCIPTTRTSHNVPVFVNNGAGPFKARDA